MRKILKSFALLIFGVWSLMLPVGAQVSRENKLQPKPPDYEYWVGEKVGISLLKKCSMFEGTIRQVRDTEISFHIREKLNAEAYDKETIQLNYVAPNYKRPTPSKWSFVDVREGGELIVFYCREATGGENQTGDYAYITSEKRFFPSIKKSVRHYINFQKNPERLLEVPNSFKINNDLIFLGYIVEVLSRGGLNYPDYTTTVLSRLMETDKIPEGKVGFTNMSLAGFLGGLRYAPIKVETREQALKILINLGNSNKKLSGQAISILARVAGKEPDFLRPYLNEQNKTQLFNKLQALPAGRVSQIEK